MIRQNHVYTILELCLYGVLYREVAYHRARLKGGLGRRDVVFQTNPQRMKILPEANSYDFEAKVLIPKQKS